MIQVIVMVVFFCCVAIISQIKHNTYCAQVTPSISIELKCDDFGAGARRIYIYLNRLSYQSLTCLYDADFPSLNEKPSSNTSSALFATISIVNKWNCVSCGIKLIKWFLFL